MKFKIMKISSLFMASSSITLLALNPSAIATPTKKLVFAYTKDAPPVSFENKYGMLSGYCGRLRSFLEKKGWNIEAVSIKYPERFKMLGTKRQDVSVNLLPAIECGPSTITNDRKKQLSSLGIGDKGWFSEPFFATSTKLIVNKEKVRKLYSTPDDLTIGVQGATTNNQVINKIFPTANIVTVVDRGDAVNRLTTSDAKMRIDAYTGDEVILIDLMKENQLSDRFLIEPKPHGYTREAYGIVVYNDKDLLNSVNNWINEDGQEAKRQLDNKSPIDSWAEVIAQSGYFHLFIKLFFLAFLALLMTNPIFLRILYTVIPPHLKKILLAWQRRKRNSHTNNPITKFIYTMLAGKKHSAKEVEVLLIVREIGLRPLFNEYVSEGLTSDQAIEKIAKTLKDIDKSNSIASKIISKWLDETGNQGFEVINSKLIEWFRA